MFVQQQTENEEEPRGLKLRLRKNQPFRRGSIWGGGLRGVWLAAPETGALRRRWLV
jgi:hypothetical protein